MLILIVEDDDDIRYSLNEYFEMQGINTVLAKTCNEGLKLLETCKPSIIILDYLLKGETCESLIEKAKRLPFHPYIVVCSASNKARTFAESYKADYFLSKPFDIGNIQKIISNYA